MHLYEMAVEISVKVGYWKEQCMKGSKEFDEYEQVKNWDEGVHLLLFAAHEGIMKLCKDDGDMTEDTIPLKNDAVF